MASFHGKFPSLYMARIFVKFKFLQESSAVLNAKGYKVFRVLDTYTLVMKKDMCKNIHSTGKLPWHVLTFMGSKS